MSSTDLTDFKKEMASNVQKSKLSLIKKRARTCRGSGSSCESANEVVVSSVSQRSVMKNNKDLDDHVPPSQNPHYQLQAQDISSELASQMHFFSDDNSDNFAKSRVSEPLKGKEIINDEEKSTFNATQGLYHSNDDLLKESNSAMINDKEKSTFNSSQGLYHSNDDASKETKRNLKNVAKKESQLRCSVQWICQECSPPSACIPVRSESRCLCGHRYKEHAMQLSKSNKNSTIDNVSFKCGAKSCPCKHFYFIVAEGAWILRCRCKHKHVDHDCSSQPFKCKKPRCVCSGFDSPWVCNCGHSWSSHLQQVVETAQPAGPIAEALEMLRQSKIPDSASGDDMADMIGQMTDGTAMRDLDLNIRRDGKY